MSNRNVETYLGDGVYVRFDGYMLVLSTSNGVERTNTIYLEPSVWRALKEYAAQLKSTEPNS